MRREPPSVVILIPLPHERLRVQAALLKAVLTARSVTRHRPKRGNNFVAVVAVEDHYRCCLLTVSEAAVTREFNDNVALIRDRHYVSPCPRKCLTSSPCPWRR